MTTVTDTDREAAAKAAVLVEMRDLILAGKADHHAEPWAEHREAEVAKIVAMLDREKAEAVEMKNHQAAFWFFQIKKEIEAGEYRNDG